MLRFVDTTLRIVRMDSNLAEAAHAGHCHPRDHWGCMVALLSACPGFVCGRRYGDSGGVVCGNITERRTLSCNPSRSPIVRRLREEMDRGGAYRQDGTVCLLHDAASRPPSTFVTPAKSHIRIVHKIDLIIATTRWRIITSPTSWRWPAPGT